MSLFFIGLSPFFPSSSFSSSTFRSLISIHCNLSFLLHLQLHISLYLSTTVRPLFFPEHYPSFMSFFFKPFFPRPLSCSSYTFSHSNLTIFFLPSFPCSSSFLCVVTMKTFLPSCSFFFTCFLQIISLAFLFRSFLTLLRLSSTPYSMVANDVLTAPSPPILPDCHCKVQLLSPTESHHFTILNNPRNQHTKIRRISHSRQFLSGQYGYN